MNVNQLLSLGHLNSSDVHMSFTTHVWSSTHWARCDGPAPLEMWRDLHVPLFGQGAAL